MIRIPRLCKKGLAGRAVERARDVQRQTARGMKSRLIPEERRPINGRMHLRFGLQMPTSRLA